MLSSHILDTEPSGSFSRSPRTLRVKTTEMFELTSPTECDASTMFRANTVQELVETVQAAGQRRLYVPL